MLFLLEAFLILRRPHDRQAVCLGLMPVSSVATALALGGELREYFALQKRQRQRLSTSQTLRFALCCFGLLHG